MEIFWHYVTAVIIAVMSAVFISVGCAALYILTCNWLDRRDARRLAEEEQNNE